MLAKLVCRELMSQYLVNNWRVELNDVLLCTDHKQSAMLPSLLVCHTAWKQGTTQPEAVNMLLGQLFEKSSVDFVVLRKIYRKSYCTNPLDFARERAAGLVAQCYLSEFGPSNSPTKISGAAGAAV